MKKDILENQALQSFSLFFDPVNRDLIRGVDEKGNLKGEYIKKLPGVEVLDNGDAVFNFYAPDAMTVQVAGIGGTMGDKKYDMKKIGNGYWTVTVSGIGAGFHYHEYFVDGNCTCSQLAPYGYGCFKAINFFEMPDDNAGFYMLDEVPHGTVRMDLYYSTVTERTRNCFIYTPPGYEKDLDKVYPTLYLQHGGGENETGWLWQGKINNIMDNLLAKGQCGEMIIVMNCGYSFHPDGSGHPAMGCIDEVLVRDCIPFIEKKYRVIKDRTARAMAGLSMGGFQTQATVFNNLEVFSAAGIFSAGFIVKNDEFDYTDLLSDATAFNKKMRLLFVSTGEQESMYEPTKKTLSELAAKGINNVMYSTPGYHEWNVWRYSACEFLKRVFQ